jgi:PAS domain S-box-containing protein
MTERLLTILVVEDEEAHVEAISRTLKAAPGNMKLIPLKTAKEFREAVSKNIGFDLVLLDMNLPDEKALDVVSELNAGSRWPVIIMTAYGDEELAVRAMKAGVIDYVVKSESTFKVIDKIISRTIREWENIQERKKAEHALFESEERFRKFIEFSPVPIVISRNGIIEYTNKALDVMIGAEENYLAGKRYIDLVAPESIETVLKYAELRRQGKPAPTVYELMGFRIDGTPIPLEMSVSQIEFKNGPVVIGYMKDLTERRNAAEALRESEERYRATVNSMDVLLHVVDRDFRIILYNDALVNILKEMGISEELTGKNIFDVFHFIPKNTKTIYKNILKSGEKFTDEQCIDTSDKTMWCETRRIPIKDSDGRVAGIITIILDITERKKMENALRDSEARTKAILEANPDLMFVLNEKGTILDYKAESEEELYKSPEEFLGKDIYEIVPPELAELTLEKILKVKETGTLHTYEYSLDINGLQYFESRVVPFGDDKFIAIIRNITEKKKAEAERLEMERRLQHVQKLESLGVLAGGIAHDFNNILTAILGHSELALFSLEPFNPVRDSIREIENASHRAAELCRQMLAYSGKGKFIIEDIDLSILISEMVNLLKASISKKAVLNMELEQDISLIKGDATQIRQIVMNLITNASDALEGKHGVIRITDGMIQCTQETLSEFAFGAGLDAGKYTYIEVTDTGIGMDRETIGHIFEPFFTTKFTGRGLGMSAVMGIVRGHNGAISIQSEPGAGSTFRIFFPSVDKVLTAGKTRPAEDSNLKKGNGMVLVVDDEEIVRSTIKPMLEKLGFSVLLASGGYEAIRIFQEKKEKINFLIIDLNMPHIDGEETLNELRKIDPSVKVLIASGYSEYELNERFAHRENLTCLQKPFSMSELSESIKKMS